MSNTHYHAHAKVRWEWSRRRDSWRFCWPKWRRHRRDSWRALIDEGLREYRDVVGVYVGEPLDYVSHDYRHAWDAALVRVKMGKRAVDRLRDRAIERSQKRYGDRLIRKFVSGIANCPACNDYQGTDHTCGDHYS